MNKISASQAKEEFEAWLELMDMHPDPARMDPDSLSGFRDLSTTITRALEQGHLVTNAEGNFELQLKTQKAAKDGGNRSLGTLVFYEPSGLAARQMDKGKGDMAKLYQFAAAMTKSDPALLDEMLERDLRVVRAIVQIFLALK